MGVIAMAVIKVDFSKKCGRVKIMHSVNNGPAGSKVRQAMNNFDTYRDAEIPYARLHDSAFYSGYGGEHTVDVHRIFKNFDADVNNPASYDFEMTDICLKDIESVGTKPFFRLGASIEHGKKFGTYPPKDFQKWAEICEHIIRHYTEGWADGFDMDIEYWEIWNEPDCVNPDGKSPCWQGTREQFAEFFTIALRHLKNCFPHLKIGGPAFCGTWDDEYNDMLFGALKEEGLVPDFYSFHGYRAEPYSYGEDGDKAYEVLEKYGLVGKTELILNEWNYVRGWLGDNYIYSMRTIRGLKGSSFIAGTMCTGQNSRLDQMMYYDARPCAWNGMFDIYELQPLKGYYPFKMYSQLYKMGESVSAVSNETCVYCVAAEDEKAAGLMVTYFMDDDGAGEKDLWIKFENFAKKGADIEYYLLDENHNMELVRSERVNSDCFTSNLTMSLYSTYFIKIIK